MKTYLHEEVGIPRAEALTINTLSMIALIALTAAFGALSDRVGRKPILIVSALSLALLAYPLLAVMNVPNFAVILSGQLAFAAIIGAYAGTAPATMAELLPHEVRVSGTSIGYNLCMALFGGTTPLVAVYLIKIRGNDLVPAYYLMAAAVVSLAVVLGLKESANRPLD
jgi:MHS family proline/betaine transporter-like MFS transporter